MPLGRDEVDKALDKKGLSQKSQIKKVNAVYYMKLTVSYRLVDI